MGMAMEGSSNNNCSCRNTDMVLIERNLKDPRQSMGFREILTETQFECNT